MRSIYVGRNIIAKEVIQQRDQTSQFYTSQGQPTGRSLGPGAQQRGGMMPRAMGPRPSFLGVYIEPPAPKVTRRSQRPFEHPRRCIERV